MYLVSWWPRCRHNVLRGLHAAVRHHGQGQVLVRLHGGAQGGWQLAKFMAKILAAINLAGPTARAGHPPVPARALRLVQGRHQRGAALRRPLRGVLQVARSGDRHSINIHIEESKTRQSVTRRGRTLSWLAGTQTPRWCSCPTVQSTPRYTAPPSPGPPGYPSN